MFVLKEKIANHWGGWEGMFIYSYPHIKSDIHLVLKKNIEADTVVSMFPLLAVYVYGFVCMWVCVFERVWRIKKHTFS